MTPFMRRSRVLILAGCLLTSIVVSGAELNRANPLAAGAGESRFASIQGHRVHYKSRGEGTEALVFIHGWTCNLEFWRLQVPAFNSRYRTIAIDLPGHGLSDKPEISYTPDLFADSVAAVLRDAGVRKAVLVGHSMGTTVARQFFRRYPDRTIGIVVVDGALRLWGTPEQMEEFVNTLRGENYQALASGFIDGMFGGHASSELRDEIKSSMLSTPRHVALSAMEGMIRPEIWKEDKITVPTLVILAKSEFWPPNTEEMVREIVPDIEYHMLDGVGHFLMMEEPDRINGIIGRYLDRRDLLTSGK